MRHAIPLTGGEALQRAAHRTTAVRVAGALVLVGLALAALVLSRHPHLHKVQFLPPQSNGIVVLDLSASISSDAYARLAATLDQVDATNGRYGLVLFSDTAYEALPPGTPAEALRPLTRFFAVPKQTEPGVAPVFPTNPWTEAFSSGTRISSGLDLARSILLDGHLRRPAVLLVSDLDDDPADVPQLASVALAYRHEGISLHVVGLNPSPEDEQLFRRLVKGTGSFARAGLPGERRGSGGVAFPAWLAALALALAAGLAANEVWLARLTWAAA
jgi:hypothetical protein